MVSILKKLFPRPSWKAERFATLALLMDRLKGRTQNESVKSSRLTGLAWLILAGTVAGARGEGARTNVNPALQYYLGFLEAPDLSPADRDYLFTNEWRGQKLPDRFG